MSNQTVKIEALRSVAFGGISGSYAVLGSAFANDARAIRIVNATNGDLLFSFDGSTDELFLMSDTMRLYDFNFNRERNANVWVKPQGTQVFVKQSTAPSSGSVYLEVFYA